MNPIGRKIISLETVDSTSNYAANLLKGGKIEHGAVILAVEQHAGRGQRMTTWQSAPGENLTFSFVLDDLRIFTSEHFKLSMMVALALIDLMRKIHIEAFIKWPNDIYANDHKLAGTLIETQIAGENIKRAIIGIGLNVNQLEFEGLNATSVRLITGNRLSLNELLLSFINSFNKLIAENHSYNDLKERYLNALYCFNEKIEVAIQGVSLHVIHKGINNDGKLLLEIDEEIKEFGLKEVSFIARSKS